MLKRIFSYMKQYKKYAFLALFCIAVEAVLELMVPMIMADLIDTGVATGDERYIYQKGFQMVLCAAAALVLGIGSAVLRRLPVRDWAQTCVKPNTKNCSRIHLPISTISGYRRL